MHYLKEKLAAVAWGNFVSLFLGTTAVLLLFWFNLAKASQEKTALWLSEKQVAATLAVICFLLVFSECRQIKKGFDHHTVHAIVWTAILAVSLAALNKQ